MLGFTQKKRQLTSAEIFPVGDMSMKFPIFIPDCCCEAGEKFILGLDGGNRDEWSTEDIVVGQVESPLSDGVRDPCGLGPDDPIRWFFSTEKN